MLGVAGAAPSAAQATFAAPVQRIAKHLATELNRKCSPTTLSPNVPRVASILAWVCAARAAVGRHWWARRDSNPQPRDYESPALTVELQALHCERASYKSCCVGVNEPPSASCGWCSFWRRLLLLLPLQSRTAPQPLPTSCPTLT